MEIAVTKNMWIVYQISYFFKKKNDNDNENENGNGNDNKDHRHSFIQSLLALINKRVALKWVHLPGMELGAWK